MTTYNPKQIYDRATMPLVEGFEESNGCDFVRFHWVCTEAEQAEINFRKERGWNPMFWQHSMINTKMALACSAGVGIPGWENLGTKIARGEPIEPTGLADDPRLPPLVSDAPKPDILAMLRDAAAKADQEIAEIHAELVAAWKARCSALKSWANVAAKKQMEGQEPTLLEAAQLRLYRKGLISEDEWVVRDGKLYSKQSHSWTRGGTWRPWEIEEIRREEARQQRIHEAEVRTDGYMKSRYPCWGGGT